MNACQRLLDWIADKKLASLAWATPSPRAEGWAAWRLSVRWRVNDRSWQEVLVDGRTPEEAAELALLEIEDE